MEGNKKNGIKIFVCIGCGKQVIKRCTKSVKFCSPECYHKYGNSGRKKNGTNKTCKICGKVFYVPKIHVKKSVFCSPECHNKYQARNKIHLICKICKKDFYVSKSFKNALYCSKDCRYKDPENIARLLEMNLEQQKRKPTKIEKIGYAVLQSNNINYKPQKLMFNKFCVDAFIPAKNLVIQFDGDYWHFNPHKFTYPDKRQKKRIQLDKSQDAYFKQVGIMVKRFWETDIIKNPECIIEYLETI